MMGGDEVRRGLGLYPNATSLPPYSHMATIAWSCSPLAKVLTTP